MTQIGRHIAPTRRPDALGVHSMDCFHMSVPDLGRARDFYAKFGLDVREEGNGLGLYTFGHPHRWGRLGEGDRKALGHLSFGVFEDDVQRFGERLRQAGIRRLDPPPGFESNGMWFRDCNGLLVELRVAEKSSPDAKSPVEHEWGGPGRRTAPIRGTTAAVRPRRLSHVLVFVRDVAESVKFYTDVLGMRLSDESGGVVAFMHGVHGSDHHMVAFAKSSAPGLHHCSWDVASIHDIGLGAMHMADSGHPEGWGLGRHVLGSNYFHYVRDPWGSYSEYSCDIDYIPVEMDWKGESHPVENSFYLWGPEPPKDFAFNHEAASEPKLPAGIMN